MNGQLISDRHLVIKPGQRVCLDRYIETAKKFKFNTYSVEDTKETKEAIIKNGDIKLYFYLQKLEISGNTNLLSSNNLLKNNDTGTQLFYKTTTLNNDVTINTWNISDANNISLNTATVTNNETGRIEVGTSSDQKFESMEIEFSSIYAYTTSFKIMPLSKKPFEVRDLIRHCCECGSKLKKEHKFCSSCGTKAE